MLCSGMLGLAMPSLSMMSRAQHEGLRMHCEQCGAGGGLSSLTRSGVCGMLGASGILAGIGFDEASSAAVDLLQVLSECGLSPLS